MFGEKLKTLRESINLYQKELANKLNVTSQTISGWEIGRTTPDFETLVKIANYFNVTIDYLLGNDALAQKIEKKYQEKEITIAFLKNIGYLDKNEKLSTEELNNIIDFIKTNKKFIKKL